MTDTARPVLMPGPDHPITIEPTGKRVVVKVDDLVVAETDHALTLREANYPPVQYLPLSEFEASSLRPSATSSYCPYKGDASYFDLVTPSREVADALWSYMSPFPAVGAIGGHGAFYPDKVQIIES